MIVGYEYTGMLVTGSLHAVLGLAGSITAIAGLVVAPVLRTYFGVALLVGLWIVLVAALGITAGIKKFEDDKIRHLNIAYMVTAILSAVIFCGVGWWIYAAVTFAGYVYAYIYENRTNVFIIGYIGLATISLEFILAIVSSSICCCCSGSTPANDATVVIQAPPQQAIYTMPFQVLPNTTMQYQVPANSTIQYQLPPMQYQPMANPTVPYQPPAYHPGNYQQQTYPMKQ